MTKLLYFVRLTGSKKCVWLCLNSCVYQTDIDLSNINILMLMDILLQVDYMQQQDTPNHYRSFIISDCNLPKLWKVISHCLNDGCLIEVSKLISIISVYDNYILQSINQICSGHNCLVIPVSHQFPDGGGNGSWYWKKGLITSLLVTCLLFKKL